MHGGVTLAKSGANDSVSDPVSDNPGAEPAARFRSASDALIDAGGV